MQPARVVLGVVVAPEAGDAGDGGESQLLLEPALERSRALGVARAFARVDADGGHVADGEALGVRSMRSPRPVELGGSGLPTGQRTIPRISARTRASRATTESSGSGMGS